MSATPNDHEGTRTTMADEEPKQLSRREFVTGVGGIGAGAVVGGLLMRGFLLPDQAMAIPVSKGYLLVDTKKCGGCESCMLACSLVHHGESNIALSRIQITQDPFGNFPDDITQTFCRQCPFPSCVGACPTGALHADTEHGNVRTVDPSKCIGCERCVQACPFTQSRSDWNFEEHHAQKCDLCANTPYLGAKGGPGGVQACIAICPMKAITFTSEIPVQNETGYTVNLRNQHWANLGLPTD